jgi:hypothetical protein
VYLWYDTVAQRQRPGGYSTTAPTGAKVTAQRLERLNCGDWSGKTATVVDGLGVRSIALHRGLYVHNPAVPSTAWFAWRGLLTHGWTVRQTAGPVWLFERRRIGLQPALVEPSRARPVFCQGWYGDLGGLSGSEPLSPSGRYMSETHAPFWIYGSGTLRLRFAPSRLSRRFTVDERRQPGPTLRLGKRGWHLVTVDVPRLIEVEDEKRNVGLRLLGVS